MLPASPPFCPSAFIVSFPLPSSAPTHLFPSEIPCLLTNAYHQRNGGPRPLPSQTVMRQCASHGIPRKGIFFGAKQCNEIRSTQWTMRAMARVRNHGSSTSFLLLTKLKVETCNNASAMQALMHSINTPSVRSLKGLPRRLLSAASSLLAPWRHLPRHQPAQGPPQSSPILISHHCRKQSWTPWTPSNTALYIRVLESTVTTL